MTKELALAISLFCSLFAILFFYIGAQTKNESTIGYGFLMLFWQIFWAYKIKSSK
jgi:hypothetical protein